MVDAVTMRQAADGAAGQRPHRHGPASFRQVLLRAFQGKATAGTTKAGVHHAAARAPVTLPAKAVTLPATSLAALNQAMTAEGVPASWQPALAFIMAHESSGRVDAQSPVHSARGLYQLTAANYHYNPNGAASFGNAVEEAQGGIRYIKQRYGTADRAMAFWQAHEWY